MNNTLTIKLSEGGIPSRDKQHKLHVDFCGGYMSSAVGIRIDGYGDLTSIDGDGTPILISVHDGIPKVTIWADINQEDPTHIISLAGASEKNRK